MDVRPVVCLHGIRPDDDTEVAGFSRPLRDLVTQHAEARGVSLGLDWREIVWADILDSHHNAALKKIPALPILDDVFDLVLDALAYSGRAVEEITRHVDRRLRAVRDETGRPPLLVAHSMGSIVSLDLLIRWQLAGRFNGPRETWPVAGLITLGSPAGIEMPIFHEIGYLNRAHVLATHRAVPGFRWIDIYDGDDPVATGSALGRLGSKREPLHEVRGYDRHCAGSFETDSGWHFGAHVAYWSDPLTASIVYGELTRT